MLQATYTTVGCAALTAYPSSEWGSKQDEVLQQAQGTPQTALTVCMTQN